MGSGGIVSALHKRVTIEDARLNVGAGVVYRPYPGAQAEDGDITTVTDRYVFVRFVGDRTSKAVAPELLEWP